MKGITSSVVGVFAAILLTLSPQGASAQDQPPPGTTFTLHITAACTPMPDLSVSDCTIVACDIAPVDSIRDGALAYLSRGYRLPANWKDTLKMDGPRVFIPFAMTLRRAG
jgi:hypothetical protein